LHLTNIHWVEDSLGYIKIYKDRTNLNTVIGGDTAGEGSDFFVAQVIDNDGYLCATLHKQFDSDLYVKQVYCLGAYYHSLIAIESNFDTFPNRELQRLKYPTLYVRETFDSIVHDVQERYGFKTTALTRPQIISELVEISREHIEKINDRETLQEMLSFVRNTKGRAEASEGTHDDLVMALAIGYHALGQLPNRTSKKIIKDERMDEDLAFFNY
jgi:phage terminase large subunit